MFQRLGALARKEFIQIIRDKRTLAMMIMLPLLWLVIFGYAFSFDVSEVKVAVIDNSGTRVGSIVVDAFRSYSGFKLVDLSDKTENGIRSAMSRDELVMGIIVPPSFGSSDQTDGAQLRAIIDGSDLFSAQAALRLISKALEPAQDKIKAEVTASAKQTMTDKIRSQVQEQADSLLAQAPPQMRSQIESQLTSHINQISSQIEISPPAPPQLIPKAEVLYNPDLKSANVMIPGLLGLVVMFMGTMMTAIGVVREREYGTMEQLVVTPIRPFELMIGKLLPYFLVATVDFALVFAAGTYLFNLHFAGNLPVFLAISLLFEFTALGLGLLISTVSQNQQQAMQLAIFVIIPQLILSGLIFPLSSMPKAIQYIGHLLPFTYFVPIARGMFIKGQSLAFMAQQVWVLCGYFVVVVGLATLRFRKRLG